VAKNLDGYELDAPGGHVASRSLVTSNRGNGIQVHNAQTNSHVLGNVVELNALEGISVSENSENNEVSGNVSRNNAGSGILLDNGDANVLLGNDVHDNLVAGIRLKSGSDGNTVGSAASPNTIHGNGDGLTDSVLCVGNLTGNVGTNVPATPACQ
jgi:parallel beta-helix repeat protein